MIGVSSVVRRMGQSQVVNPPARRPTGVLPWPVEPPPPPPPPPQQSVPEPYYNRPLSSAESAAAFKKLLIAGGIAILPTVKKPVSPALSPALYTAGVLGFNLTGGGVSHEHVKVSPIALAAWFALPAPFGFQDPKAYGLKRDYQLGHVPIRPLEITDEVLRHLGNVVHGHTRSVSELEALNAIEAGYREQGRKTFPLLGTDTLLKLAAGQETAFDETAGILRFHRGFQQSLLEELASRGIRREGNFLIVPARAGPDNLPRLQPVDP